MSLWVTNIRSKQLPQPCKSTFLWFSHYILCHYLGDKSLFFAVVISFHCGRKEANGDEEEKRKHSFFRNTLTSNMISFQTFQEERILLHPKWQHRKKCNKKKVNGCAGRRTARKMGKTRNSENDNDYIKNGTQTEKNMSIEQQRMTRMSDAEKKRAQLLKNFPFNIFLPVGFGSWQRRRRRSRQLWPLKF